MGTETGNLQANLSEPSLEATGYERWSIRAILFFSCFLAGSSYVWFEWYYTLEVQDAIFVSMLLAATGLLLIGVRSIDRHLLRCHTIEHTNPNLIGLLKNWRPMSIAGALYGAVVGLSPFVLSVWESEIVLRSMLSLFLFLINFVTGVAFYALMRFLVIVVKLSSTIQLGLWEQDTPFTVCYLGATRRIAVLASCYICMCISSILFSVIPLRFLVVSYSLFCAVVLLGTIAVPLYPIVLARRSNKLEALSEINRQIQEEYSEMLSKLRSKNDTIEFSRMDSMLALRERISRIDVWPFKLSTVAAGLVVIFFSSVPVVLQVILERAIDH